MPLQNSRIYHLMPLVHFKSQNYQFQLIINSIVITIDIFHLVHNADERTVTKNVTATVGSTFDVRWYIRWERYIFYVSTNMEKPEQRFILSSGSAGFSRKYPKHEELFGNRLITDFMYLRSGFRIQLKDVRYNETLSFHLKTVFDINTSVTTTYNMIVVGIVHFKLY